MPADLTPELLRQAVVDRDRPSIRAVVRRLTPILHARIARVLLRRGSMARGRDLRQEVEDLAQDAFEMLLADNARRMLGWDPARGAASTYFGLIAERCAINVLASRRRNPWSAEPTELRQIECAANQAPDPEQRAGSRQMLRRLGQRLLQALNERDRSLFELMYIRRLDDEAVRQRLGIGREALYQARRRLLQRVRKLATDMGPEYERMLAGER